MELSSKQQRFTLLISRLIFWAYSKGYALTFGEAYRTPEQAALNAKKGTGIANSLHTQRLAVDLNLFIKDLDSGVFQYQSDSKAYKKLGDYWKTLDPACAWGGDFKRQDGNHFSFEHNGVK
jgi:hypothetical protein